MDQLFGAMTPFSRSQGQAYGQDTRKYHGNRMSRFWIIKVMILITAIEVFFKLKSVGHNLHTCNSFGEWNSFSHCSFSNFSCVPTLSPRRQKTSVLCALERRASASRALHSTGWSPTSCVRVETSPGTMVPVERASMERSSQMRTSHWSTLDLVWNFMKLWFVYCNGLRADLKVIKGIFLFLVTQPAYFFDLT